MYEAREHIKKKKKIAMILYHRYRANDWFIRQK